jgi:hypothetical protein
LSTTLKLPCALAFAALALTSSTRARAQDDDLVVPADSAPPTKPAPQPPPAATAPPPAAPRPSAAAPAASASLLPPPSPPPPGPDVEAELRELRELRDEVHELRARQDAQHPVLEIWDSTKSSTSPWDIPGRDGLWFTGYLQSQYETHQDSQDQLAPGGTPLNKDRFLVRRARLKFIGEWKFAEAQIEINADTVNGPNINLHHAEATLHYRPQPDAIPLVAATLGLFDTPFGYEVPESPRSRPFMERTTMSRAFWPGEPDLGLRVAGGLGFFRWTLAAMNGFPQSSPRFAYQDPIGAKDFIVRVGADTSPRPGLRIAGDVSVLDGTGFHAGTDATKSTVQWNDLNEDGIVQPNELQGVPGQAATPSQTFSHWAVGASLQVSIDTPIGPTKIYGEATIAQNMDRSLVVADPVATGTDSRELGWYVGVVQEVMTYGLVGFRYDYYDPNADVFDSRGGRLIPYSNQIQTFSPLLGLQLPHRARALMQYDAVRNYLGRDAEGVPTNLKMNTLTLRLQVEL